MKVRLRLGIANPFHFVSTPQLTICFGGYYGRFMNIQTKESSLGATKTPSTKKCY
jgi:hypothetical protein